MYALPPVLLGGQLSDLADVAAGRQEIRPDPFQLGLGVAMLLLLVLLAATSHRWLEAEQQGAAMAESEGAAMAESDSALELPRGIDDIETDSASELPRGDTETDDIETELVLTPTPCKQEASISPTSVV